VPVAIGATAPFSAFRINPQAMLFSAETPTILFWGLPVTCQINMRKVDGWIDLA
jgi:hypothetical protein